MRKVIVYAMIPLMGILSAKVKNTNKKSARALGIEQTDSVNNDTRYETNIYFRDFEGDVSDWVPDGGWIHSDGNSSSPIHSFISPNAQTTDAEGTAQDSARAFWNMLSLDIEIPEKNLLIEALIAYKDDDNEEYNFEINQLIEKLKND